MTSRSSEESRIHAARIYIDKLRSMHPSDEVLRNLDAQERDLEKREQELSQRSNRTPAIAGR